MDNAAIAIASISAIATLIGGGFATWQQIRKDAKMNNVELIRLQEEIEKDLWIRMKGEFSSMEKRVDDLTLLVEKLTADKRELSATVSSQGAMMIQMQSQIETLQLDRDHWQRRAIEAEGRTKRGRV